MAGPGSQQAEKFFRRSRFPLGLVLIGGNVKGEGVPGVNLDEVVDSHHGQNPAQIHRLGGIFLKDDGHEGKMPGMLGIVLLPGAICEKGAADNGLHLVHLSNKNQLTLEPLGQGSCSRTIQCLLNLFQ